MAAGAALEPFNAPPGSMEGDPIPSAESTPTGVPNDGFGRLLSHWEGHLAQVALFVDIGFKSTQNGRYENTYSLFQDRHPRIHIERKPFIEQALVDQNHKPIVLF